MPYDKDTAIIAQNSATAAAAIVASATGPMHSTDEVLEEFDKVRQHIFKGTMHLAGAPLVSPAEAGEAALAAVSTPVSETTVPAAPVPAPAPAYATSGGNGNNKPDPGNISLRGGKHRGRKLADVAGDDPGWIEWAARESNQDFVKRITNEFLDAHPDVRAAGAAQNAARAS